MDPILALAFGMHSQKGVYAILLGSGISRSAAIPTGWELVVDLIKKLAAMKGETCDPDPEAWFETTFGEAPSYSLLLKKIARSPAERQQLLRSYFEPSAAETESEVGTKAPTSAHHALAALAKTGHVRVILTTNFDRLMERALDAAGVSHTVISTPSGIDGALPLTHAPCTVVKPHGDYLDARIKNTPEELAKYDKRIDRLLDRVLDEFGLVVCGWSADWDEALRGALERCKSRRFTTYWTTCGNPSESARRLIAQRAAQVIPIPGADGFFRELHQKVTALTAFDPPHPLSARTAVATMKRLLSEDRHRIELHDLVLGEVERVMEATSDALMPVSGSVRSTPTEIVHRMGQYEAITSILRDLVVAGCYWGNQTQEYLWTSALERLSNRPVTGGVTFWIDLRRYPALLVFYAAGITALKAMNMGAFRALVLDPQVRANTGSDRAGPAVRELRRTARNEPSPHDHPALRQVHVLTHLQQHVPAPLHDRRGDVLRADVPL